MLHIEQWPAQEFASQTSGDIRLTIGEESEDPSGQDCGDYRLAHEHGHSQAGQKYRELSHRQALNAQQVQEPLDDGRNRGESYTRHSHRSQKANERDADQVEDAERDLNSRGEQQQPALAWWQKVQGALQGRPQALRGEILDALALPLHEGLVVEVGCRFGHIANLLCSEPPTVE